MTNFTLLTRQRDMLLKMIKRKPIHFKMIGRGGGKSYFIDFVIKNFPELADTYNLYQAKYRTHEHFLINKLLPNDNKRKI